MMSVVLTGFEAQLTLFSSLTTEKKLLSPNLILRALTRNQTEVHTHNFLKSLWYFNVHSLLFLCHFRIFAGVWQIDLCLCKAQKFALSWEKIEKFNL